MTLRIIHKGVALNQQQLDAIVSVVDDNMNGRIKGLKKFHEAIDNALEVAGCPVVEPVKDNQPQG